LYSAWKKYGKEDFVFELVEECLPEQLKEKEEYWMNKKESCNGKKGYNMTKISNGNQVVSDETKKKISAASKGRIKSEETRKKLSEAMSRKFGKDNSHFGHKHTEEYKKKMSKVMSCENNPNIILNFAKVDEVREMYSDGYRNSEIAKKLCMAEGMVLSVVNFKTWKYKSCGSEITQEEKNDLLSKHEIGLKNRKFVAKKCHYLNWGEVRQIRKEYSKELKNGLEVAKKFDISYITFERIVNFRTWKDDPLEQSSLQSNKECAIVNTQDDKSQPTQQAEIVVQQES
jgi:group I intron endonuclease